MKGRFASATHVQFLPQMHGLSLWRCIAVVRGGLLLIIDNSSIQDVVPMGPYEMGNAQ